MLCGKDPHIALYSKTLARDGIELQNLNNLLPVELQTIHRLLAHGHDLHDITLHAVCPEFQISRRTLKLHGDKLTHDARPRRAPRARRNMDH